MYRVDIWGAVRLGILILGVQILLHGRGMEDKHRNINKSDVGKELGRIAGSQLTTQG